LILFGTGLDQGFGKDRPFQKFGQLQKAVFLGLGERIQALKIS